MAMVAKRMRLLVTGATGRIGKRLLEKIDRNKYEVSVLIRNNVDRSEMKGCRVVIGDLSCFDGWEKQLAEEEILVHLAARVDMFAREVEGVNFEGTRRLVESMPKLKKVVFASTIEAYGPTGKKPVTIEKEGEPVCPYGESKLKAEKWLRLESARRGFELVILRIGNVVGFDGDMIESLRQGGRVTNWLSLVFGDFELAPVDIGVVIRVLIDEMEKSKGCLRWVVGKSTSIDELLGRRVTKRSMIWREGLVWLMRRFGKGGVWLYITLGGTGRRYRRYV